MKTRKFIRLKKKRPTKKDAIDFLSKGHWGVASEDYVSPKEREKRIEETASQIQVLLKKNMPRGKNLDLIILKGHILLEFMLNQFISLKAPVEVDIEKQRFTFSQKIDIAYMLGLMLDPIFYATLDIVNSLRNQVAHKLTVDRQLVDQLIKYNSDEDEIEQLDDSARAKWLKSIIRFWCGGIMGAIRGMHVELYEELYEEGKLRIQKKR